MTARYSAADYGAAARALMPRGRVWSLEPGTVQAQVMDSLMSPLERLDASAVALLGDIFPASTSALLAEWEESFGLPDPCLVPNATDDQRRDQVVARFTGGGGQSAARFTAFAAALGFEISITVYAPFRAGCARAGGRLLGAAWAHAWLVTVRSDATSANHAAFRSGRSHAGEALVSSAGGHAALECELRRIAPAHTVLRFSS
jgi:uncharacterized protein YmfQ (DUF2313 family)